MEKTLKPSVVLPRVICFPDIAYSVRDYPSLSHVIVNKAEVLRPFFSSDRKTEEPHPLVIYVVGGGFTVCPPFSMLSTLYELARHGYVVASITYPTVNETPFPSQIEDVKSAVRFFRKNASKFGVDPEKIAIMGESAGGTLAALAGITADTGLFETDENPDVSERVSAVVDYYGVTDMVNTVKSNPALFGAACTLLFRMDSELAESANPLNYNLKNAPPFLLLHGTEDPVVSPSDSKKLYDRLKDSGVEAKLIWVEGAGHATPHFCQKEVNDEVFAFLDSHLK